MAEDFPTTDEMVGALVADFNQEPEGDATDVTEPDVLLDDRAEGEPEVMHVEPGTIERSSAEDPDVPAPTAKESELATQLKQVREESAGRLNEMVEMRKTQKETTENVEAMRKMMLDEMQQKRTADLHAKEVEAYGEDTMADPAVRAIRDDNARTREMIRRQSEREEHQRQEASRVQAEQDAMSAQEKKVVDAAEASYAPVVAEHPDFEKAYEHSKNARMGIYQRRGLTGENLEKVMMIEEFQLANEAMKAGKSPAQATWDLAVELGYQSEVVAPQVNTGGHEGIHQSLDKLREGLKTTTLSNVQTTQGQGRRISRQQFFETMPKHERIAVLSNQTKARQLAQTGFVDLD